LEYQEGGLDQNLKKQKLIKSKIREITTIPKKGPHKAAVKSIPPRKINTSMAQGY